MAKHALSILAFLIVSFAVQGFSHFIINAEHFAAIAFMRPQPILILGLSVMLVQGAIMSVALDKISPKGTTVRDGLVIALAFGVFLGSYIALVEPSKYAVPSLLGWISVEGSASLVQFVVSGVLMGLIHRRLG